MPNMTESQRAAIHRRFVTIAQIARRVSERIDAILYPEEV